MEHDMIIAVLSVSLTLILGTVCSVFAQSNLDSVLATAKKSLNTNKNQESKRDLIQSETTDNYKNYDNSTYGVKVKYPEDWKYFYQDADYYETFPETIFHVMFLHEIKAEDYDTTLAISIEKIEPPEITLAEYSDRLVTNLKSVYPDVKDISVSKDNLAGQPAYRNEHMTWMLDHWQKSVSLFTIKNGKLFEVSILAEPKKIEENSKDISNIKQSVKFEQPAPIKVSSTDVPDKPVVKTKNSPNVVKKSTKQSNCDSSYPDFCIPSPPPNLNCPDISQKRFTVTGSDSHGFDRDHDGIGCES
jgi:hypothetical protein